MRQYALSHVSDAALLRDLAALVGQDRLTTAALLAHIAEVDARKLYVPEGYSSMHEFCIGEFKLSEDAAYKRIQAARAARQFPTIFEGLADGRFHLSGICLLVPHLTPENAEELLRAAEGRRKSEIEEMLDRRFSRWVLPPIFQPPILQACHSVSEHSGMCATPLAPGQVEVSGETDIELASTVDQVVSPPERYLLQFLVERATHEKLRYAQALLSHAVPSGDVAEVVDRALDSLITQLERRKLGGRVRAPSATAAGEARHDSAVAPIASSHARGRYIPSHVRRAVWERDQGRCTFVGASGHRCDARRFLEFDHIDPVARGGQATVDGMRLRCRAHNQYEAERAFGKEFMAAKRHEARARGAQARAAARAEARAGAWRAQAQGQSETRNWAAKEATQDIIAALRGLGCSAREARRAVELTAPSPGATLEERMRAALSLLGRRSVHGRPGFRALNVRGEPAGALG